MTLKNLQILILLLCLFGNKIYAQNKAPVTFGKVTASDFTLVNNVQNENAHAVILADKGISEVKHNGRGELYLEFNRKCRIHILSKNGFDAANIEIPLYIEKDAIERLDKVQATTYNLVNGNVDITKLENRDVFKESVNKNWKYIKFTLPNVQEGSIIEFTYTITSDFLFNLQSWEFQSEYPVLWSEYEVVIPDRLEYVSLLQGYVSPHIFSKTPGRLYTEPYTASRWVMKDVVALKEENYTSTVNNHIAKIEFQLSKISNPLSIPINVMSDWKKVNERMMADENFGGELRKNNNWLQSHIKTIKGDSKDPLEIARKIYAYLRDNFSCTQNSGVFTKTSLKNVMNAKSGTVAEINLLLCAMLEYEKLTVSPVILSMRDRGLTHPVYPIMSRYNYVICELLLNKKTYYLDASRSEFPFAKLDPQCYNGHARVMGKEGRSINLFADELVDERKTLVFIGGGEKTDSMEGSIQQQPGYLGSIIIRRKVQEKKEDGYFRDLTKGMVGMELVSHSLENIDDKEKLVNVNADFNMEIAGSHLYFNPLMMERFGENPFTAAERNYPVEMPFGMKYSYTLNMEVPKGYVVEELPSSVRVLLNDTDGKFEYRIQQQGTLIQLVTTFHLSRANYFNEEYENIRQFFAAVVKKHQENIVFKKI